MLDEEVISKLKNGGVFSSIINNLADDHDGFFIWFETEVVIINCQPIPHNFMAPNYYVFQVKNKRGNYAWILTHLISFLNSVESDDSKMGFNIVAGFWTLLTCLFANFIIQGHAKVTFYEHPNFQGKATQSKLDCEKR